MDNTDATSSLVRYLPLVIILLMITLASLALSGGRPVAFMHDFMGLFFVIFAMFKFFDMAGFVRGFRKYDILAQWIPPYGWLYPLLELALGLLYLSMVCLRETYIATIVLMMVSAAGVVREIKRGNQFTCACLGTTLNVPLSTVSVVENVGMGLMAGLMLATQIA